MLFVVSIENLKTLSNIFEKKTYVIAVIWYKLENKDEDIFKEESTETLKILALIKNI